MREIPDATVSGTAYECHSKECYQLSQSVPEIVKQTPGAIGVTWGGGTFFSKYLFLQDEAQLQCHSVPVRWVMRPRKRNTSERQAVGQARLYPVKDLRAKGLSDCRPRGWVGDHSFTSMLGQGESGLVLRQAHRRTGATFEWKVREATMSPRDEAN